MGMVKLIQNIFVSRMICTSHYNSHNEKDEDELEIYKVKVEDKHVNY